MYFGLRVGLTAVLGAAQLVTGVVVAQSDDPEFEGKALTAVFDDKYEDVRREAVTACGMIGPAAKACIPHLQGKLGDALPVRNAAAWTCGRMGALAAGHMDLLIARLQGDTLLDRNTERTAAVPDAIGILGPVHANVVPNLLRDREQARLAVRAVKAIGPAAAEVALALKSLADGKNRPAHIAEADWIKVSQEAAAALAAVRGDGT